MRAAILLHCTIVASLGAAVASCGQGATEGASDSATLDADVATADAVDIAAFRLADGTAISIVADWAEPGAKAAFLHRVRDGGCDLFATVLSPDYNAAHADHVHFDQAQRGAFGWRGCR